MSVDDKDSTHMHIVFLPRYRLGVLIIIILLLSRTVAYKWPKRFHCSARTAIVFGYVFWR